MSDKNDGSHPEQWLSSSESSVSEMALPEEDVQNDETPTIISSGRVRPATPEELMTGALKGQRLAHFEFIAPVGVGGMAAVIKARDLQLDRLVALKVLPPEWANDDAIQRFQQEAKAAAKLDHENIARVFYYGEDRGLHFIAFEFVEGRNLRILMEQRGRIPVSEALHYLIQAATGLIHAAERSVVHRDIKPSNIIITPNGRAKLVDMGLARSLAPQEDLELTRSGVTLGTFDYISPEQALEPRAADSRSDIYSLGCTFYHVLSGRPPVPEGNAARKLHYQQTIEPIDPRQWNNDIPDEVAMILSKMMAKDPEERYQTPKELVQDLLAITSSPEQAGEKSTGLYYVDVPLPNGSIFKPFFLLVLAIGVVIALVLTLGNARRNTSTGSFVVQEPSRGKLTQPGAEKDASIPAIPKDRENPPQKPIQDSGHYSYRVTKETGEGLRQFLSELPDDVDAEPKEIELIFEGNIDLSWLKELQGLKIHASDRLILTSARALKSEARTDTDRPVIRLQYEPGAKGGTSVSWAALMLGAERIEVRDLCFVFETNSENIADQAICGLMIDAGRQTLIEDCLFLQIGDVKDREESVSSLSIVNPSQKNTSARVTLQDCIFVGATRSDRINNGQLTGVEQGGNTAITRYGAVSLTVANSAFGAFHTAIDLERGRMVRRSRSMECRMNHCTFQLQDGSAVLNLEEDIQEKVQLEHCLFARTTSSSNRMPEMQPETNTLLIRQPSDLGNKPMFELTAINNVGYQLDGLWGDENHDILYTWEDFFDNQSTKSPEEFIWRELLESPWASETIVLDLSKRQFADAFRVKADRQSLHSDDQSERLVGLLNIDNVEYRSKKSPTTLTVRQRQRIVNPSLTVLREGEYRSLAVALEFVKDGDTILLQHTGELSVRSLKLAEVDAEITIRPYPGYHPKLTLDAVDQNDVLFNLYTGTLKLENLEIELRAKQGVESQSIVSLLGQGRCLFKNCVLTLQSSEDSTFAVVTVEKPGIVDKSDKKPQLTLTHCLVRGQGHVIWYQHPRSVQVQIAHSLLVSSDSFLLISEKAVGKSGMPLLMTKVPDIHLKVEKTTAYLDKHLLQAKVSDLQTMPRLHWEVSKCIFASSSGDSLVELTGLKEISQQALSSAFEWNGDNNLYSGFMWMLDQQLSKGMTTGMQRPLNARKWQELTQEMMSVHELITFDDPPETTEEFSKVIPSQFESKQTERGADLPKLPKLTESKPRLKP